MISVDNASILVTGAAGFIGANLIIRILNEYKNVNVIGLDNMNDYYDVSLKEYRLEQINDVISSQNQGNDWTFIKGSISESATIKDLFKEYEFDIVVNLAAQAGVRYSISHPEAYIESNIIGFFNILEACRYDKALKHLVYASSSSVYGNNKSVPYSTTDKVDNPVSLYAATKKSDELLAHAYSKLYGIPSTGLRFFTVYGPAGRPDMAYFSFTDKLVRGEKIELFNYGNCKRDFTYIDDIIEGITRVIPTPPLHRKDEDGWDNPPCALYNIGKGAPDDLRRFVSILYDALVSEGVITGQEGIESYLELVEMQPGDVVITYADTEEMERGFGYRPTTSLEEGLRHFAKWYKEYYRNATD